MSEADFAAGLTMLCESVGERMRAAGLYGSCVTVQIKDPDLKVISRQTRFSEPTNVTSDIIRAARELVRRNWREGMPARMLAVSVSALSDSRGARQLSFFDGDGQHEERGRRLYSAVDDIRSRFGSGALRMGSMLSTDIIAPGDAGASDEERSK